MHVIDDQRPNHRFIGRCVPDRRAGPEEVIEVPDAVEMQEPRTCEHLHPQTPLLFDRHFHRPA